METTGAATAKQGRPQDANLKRGGKKAVLKPPQLLSDMRAVYRQEETEDRRPGQKALRAMLIDDPKGFISQLGQLERQWAARRDGGKAAQQAAQAAANEGGEVAAPVAEQEAEEVAGDVGEGRVVELIERLLGEWGNGA